LLNSVILSLSSSDNKTKAVKVDSMIYIIGGRKRNGGNLNEIQTIDTSNNNFEVRTLFMNITESWNSWTQEAISEKKFFSRNYHSCVPLPEREKILIFGGSHWNSSAEVEDELVMEYNYSR
jgi:hypothetical protein